MNTSIKYVVTVLLLGWLFLPQSTQASRIWAVITDAGYTISTDSDLSTPPIYRQLELLQTLGGSSNSWPYNNYSGWGLVWYGNDFQEDRGANPAYDNSVYDAAETAVLQSVAPVALGHVRRATTGATDIPNPHPWVYEYNGSTYTFAHNGTVDKQTLRNLIGEDWLDAHPPQTWGEYGYGGDWDGAGWEYVVDSELYFLWLMQNIEEADGLVLTGLNIALNQLEAAQSDGDKNFVLSDGTTLYAYRSSDDTYPQHHELFYATSSPSPLYTQHHKAVMSSTEGIVESLHDWQAIANYSMVVLPRDDNVQVIENFHQYGSHEFKPLHAGWNWEAFPRLERDANGMQPAEEVVAWLEPDAQEVQGMSSNGQVNMVWVTNSGWDHDGGLYNFTSTAGYKIEMTSGYPDTLLPVAGDRIDPQTPLTIYPGQENWLGYFLPYSQDPLDAFPAAALSAMTAIYGEGWAYTKQYNPETKRYEWLGRQVCQFGGDCIPLTVNYGEMVIVETTEEITFQWQDGQPRERTKAPAPHYFTVETQPSYEVVYVDTVISDQPVTEIGVRAGDQVVGASPVTGYPTQILAYTTGTTVPLTFEVVTAASDRSTGLGKRSPTAAPAIQRTDVSTVGLRDPLTGTFHPQAVQPHTQPYYTVTLQVGAPASAPSQPATVRVQPANPNPFNPTTQLTYTLPEATEMTLTVYNLRGQQVRLLQQGYLAAGDHTVRWDSRNDRGHPVSSGVYIVQFRTADQVHNQKVMLLR